MNILLATYNYYPYNYGGTEVYVSGLASFLQNQGHDVTIVAGMSPKAFLDYPLFYEDAQQKAVEYYFDSIRVIGVAMKNTSTTDIYRKYADEFVASWQKLFGKLGKQWDLLHIHANTMAIGLNLIKAIKIHSSAISTIASCHVPLTCVKGTLMFGTGSKVCSVKPETNICTACSISGKEHIPITITKNIVRIMPVMATDSIPTFARLKFLTSEFIKAFRNFDNEINLWHVFSEEIRSILHLCDVPTEKMKLLRHGVSADFFYDNIEKRQTSSTKIFLYASRFIKAKGFYTVLKAWLQIPESAGRELWMAGDNQANDPEIAKMIGLCENRKDIKWMGARQQEDIADLMKNAHCVIIPSEWVEIGPLIFHEAIAAGADVIASDIVGCSELAKLYQQKSHVFETGNIGSLVNQIIDFRFSGQSAVPLTQNSNYEQVMNSYSALINKAIIVE